VEVGEEIPSHHGCTALYAPPELVRWLYGSSNGGRGVGEFEINGYVECGSVFDGDCKWRGICLNIWGWMRKG